MKTLAVRSAVIWLVVLSITLAGCSTPTPTAIPSVEPTATSIASTDTATPTATATVTATPVPPTNTPTVTSTPTPAPTATRTPIPLPTKTKAPPATAAPKTPPLADAVKKVRDQVADIGGAMDRIYHGGGGEACPPLLTDYFGVAAAPTYDMSAQPGNVQSAYDKYRAAINVITDSIAPITKVCLTGGGSIGTLDFNNARTKINVAGDYLGQALQLLGQ